MMDCFGNIRSQFGPNHIILFTPPKAIYVKQTRIEQASIRSPNFIMDDNVPEDSTDRQEESAIEKAIESTFRAFLNKVATIIID